MHDRDAQQQYPRDDLVRALRRWGFSELVDRATRDLPDPFDHDQLEAWCRKVGLTLSQVESRMGYSP